MSIYPISVTVKSMPSQNMSSIKKNVPSAWYPTMDSFIAKGKNAEIWDKNNNRYLDFVGGYAVLNTGHLNPRVVRRVKKQLNDYSHSCFAFAPHENAVELCDQINKRYPINQKTKTFLVNSGAEAVENAIKIARYATGREKIIAFKGGFHGRTYLAMGLTGKEKPYKEGFGPFPKFISHIDFPYDYRGISDDKVIKQLQNLISKKIDPNDIAAIVVEIQLGEGGYIPASNGFLKKLREITKKHNILLIFDEVQTGFGRTGEMFGATKVNVEPDMVTLAKGIGGGFPLAAVVGKSKIMDSVHDAGIGSTFGASPISCAAALGVLELQIAQLLCTARCRGELPDTVQLCRGAEEKLAAAEAKTEAAQKLATAEANEAAVARMAKLEEQIRQLEQENREYRRQLREQAQDEKFDRIKGKSGGSSSSSYRSTIVDSGTTFMF